MVLLHLSPCSALTLTTLVSFGGTNGAAPSAALLQGADGNFRGTTESGGMPGSRGTIFMMTPSGALTTLLEFASPYSYGADPQAALVLGPDGDFYGAAPAGGAYSRGTAFRISPDGVPDLLYSFVGTYDGSQPFGALARGSDGNLYGTTFGGGFYLNGTVFQMTTNGTLNSLYSFSGPDGANPYAGLIQGRDGNFYGTTEYGGGAYNGTDFSGQGTIFQLMANGTLNTLVYFGGKNGVYPTAGLVQAADGRFYGTTYRGGTNGDNGTVFRMSTNGALTTLVMFNGTNGALPSSGLVGATDGSFYGTTSCGGIGYNGSPSSGYGTVFKVTTNGVLTTVAFFTGINGNTPLAGLVQGTDGNLYGTTSGGGAYNNGTVFQLSSASSPPPVFQTVSQSGAIITLTWSAVAGRAYQVQASTNFSQANWNNKNGLVTATNSTATWSEGVGPDPQRFYRVLLLP
ncbi:MAG TPA: choice-of-anchor tandem repeat GloVer-containing protein [Candidatus Acidoferrum sp.]|nr:choice-of-anchor tandem repeat GloVer-containing protein [Candidatus Acidoferrum sp.]